MASVIHAPTFGQKLLDETHLAAHPIYGRRPLLRGRIHQASALASIPVGFHVVFDLAVPANRVAAAAYAVTWTLMFTASAVYHRLAQSVLARFWMRRVDHAMILVHIAGATTPIALLGVGGLPGRLLVVASWICGLAGASLKLTRLTDDADPGRWCFALLGWMPLVALPSLVTGQGWATAGLLLAATCTYGVGAVCFARKRPDPIPRIFGYHEVWHVVTLVAGCFQLALMILLVEGGRGLA